MHCITAQIRQIIDTLKLKPTRNRTTESRRRQQLSDSAACYLAALTMTGDPATRV